MGRGEERGEERGGRRGLTELDVCYMCAQEVVVYEMGLCMDSMFMQ